MLRSTLGLLSLVFCLSFGSLSEAKFKTPWLSGPVMDEVGILAPEDKAEIEQLLRSFNQRDMAQIQVYITSSLQDLPIEQASIDITDQWKLGSKEKDNGLLFLIAPNERKMRIEVGQGLEGIMTDLHTKKIQDDIVVPYFKEQRMSEGVLNGVKAIITVLDGEELQSIAKPHSAGGGGGGGISLPFWVIVPLWILIILMGRLGGGRRRYMGGRWGGGGFGGGFGGGGGGWSGGGGGFSGGGSSSSW